MISRRKLFGMLGVAPVAAVSAIALPMNGAEREYTVKLGLDAGDLSFIKTLMRSMADLNFRVKEIYAHRSNNRVLPMEPSRDMMRDLLKRFQDIYGIAPS
jgi:hypothetical protein